jgi:hypothetical protein
MNKALLTAVAIILVLAIAGGSFYGGMVYGKSQAQAARLAGGAVFMAGGPNASGVNAAGTPGAFRPQRSGQGGGMTVGTIKEISDGVLVLTNADGKETQIKVTDTTMIEKNASVELTDLAEGETVLVSGSAGTDGTITARLVQVAPQGRFGMMGGPGDPMPRATPTQ